MFKQRLMPGWIILMGALTAIGPLSIDMYLPGFPAIGKEFDAGCNRPTLLRPDQ